MDKLSESAECDGDPLGEGYSDEVIIFLKLLPIKCAKLIWYSLLYHIYQI